MDAAMYLRQSLDRTGEALAVARQRRDCLALCEQRGWTPIEYLDNDRSASKGIRPAYQQMLADIKAKKVAAVVVWDADRLHRQPRELEDFINLADAHKLALATVAGGDFDLATPTGRGNARMKGVFARMEMEQKSARQKAEAEQRAMRGLPKWKHAFGYVQGPNGPEPDPEIAPLVVEAYKAVLAGSSLGDICRLWNDAGALTQRWIRPKDENGDIIKTAEARMERRPWTQPQVSNFLRKARNAGLRTYGTDLETGKPEIVGDATWPPLVDKALWKSVQAVLDSPGRAPGRKSVQRHLLTGILRCGKPGCGGYLVGRHLSDKAGITYSCRLCRGVAIRAAHIEPMMYRLVGDRLAQDDARDLLRAKIHDEAEAEAIRTELNELYGELEKIGVERGQRLLTGQQAKIASDLVQADIDALEAKQQSAERVRVLADIPLGRAGARAAVKRLSPDRFRAVINLLMAPTVMPVGRGSHNRKFNPGRVHENWHQPADFPAA
jgi:DNA invertase Pin-like site-specific DNA recombinase